MVKMVYSNKVAMVKMVYSNKGGRASEDRRRGADVYGRNLLPLSFKEHVSWAVTLKITR
jgi:hypothetical protein